MGKYGKERLVLTEPFGPPTGTVDLGMGLDKDGNKISAAGAEVVSVADDDFVQSDLDYNTANPAGKKSITGVTLGTCRALLGGTVAKGDKLAVDANAKFQVATAGQAVAAIAREGGASGDLIEAFKIPVNLQVASANIVALTTSVGVANDTIPDVGGAFTQATLNDINKTFATKINAILTLLQAQKEML